MLAAKDFAYFFFENNSIKMRTTDVAKKVLTNESKRIKVRFGQNLISGTVASSTVNL